MAARTVALVGVLALVLATARVNGRFLEWIHNNNFDEDGNWKEGAVPGLNSDVDLTPLQTFGRGIGAQVYIGPTAKSDNGNVEIKSLKLPTSGSIELGVGSSITFSSPLKRTQSTSEPAIFKVKKQSEMLFSCAANYRELDSNFQPISMSEYRPPCNDDDLILPARSATSMIVPDGARVRSIRYGSRTISFETVEQLEVAKNEIFFPVRDIQIGQSTCGTKCDLFCLNDLDVCPSDPAFTKAIDQVDERIEFAEAVEDLREYQATETNSGLIDPLRDTSGFDLTFYSVPIPVNYPRAALERAEKKGADAMAAHFANVKDIQFSQLGCCGTVSGTALTTGCIDAVSSAYRQSGQFVCRFRTDFPASALQSPDNLLGWITPQVIEDAAAEALVDLLEAEKLRGPSLSAADALASPWKELCLSVTNGNANMYELLGDAVPMHDDDDTNLMSGIIADGLFNVVVFDKDYGTEVEGVIQQSVTPLAMALDRLSSFAPSSSQQCKAALRVQKFSSNLPDLASKLSDSSIKRGSSAYSAIVDGIRDHLRNKFSARKGSLPNLEFSHFALTIPNDSAGRRSRRSAGDVDVFVAVDVTDGSAADLFIADDFNGLAIPGTSDTTADATMSFKTLLDLIGREVSLIETQSSASAAATQDADFDECGHGNPTMVEVLEFGMTNVLDFEGLGNSTRTDNTLTVSIANVTKTKAYEQGLAAFYADLATVIERTLGGALQARCLNFSGDFEWHPEYAGYTADHDPATFTIPRLEVTSELDLSHPQAHAELKDVVEIALQYHTFVTNKNAAGDDLEELEAQRNVLAPPPPASSSGGSSSMMPIIAGAAAAVIVLIVIIAFFVMRNRSDSKPRVRRQGSKGSVDRTVVAFENPMYDDPQDDLGAPVYDATAGGGGDDEGLYDQPAFHDGAESEDEPEPEPYQANLDSDPEMEDGGGYLDVAAEADVAPEPTLPSQPMPTYDMGTTAVEALYDDETGLALDSDAEDTGYLDQDPEDE
eukprot:m.302855 g.302855  ORF g.302855 m.302855 type:complete len:999 (-) comp19583_c0_seq3:213-3209(-)